MHADAADCWTFVPGGQELVCRAVLGLPEDGGRPPDSRPWHDRRGDRERQARPAARLRGHRAAAAGGPLRRLLRGDGRADLLLRRDPRRARRLVARAGPVRGVRPAADRGVREPGLGRPAERRGLRGEPAADAGRACVLPDRGGAERAAVGRGDARRGRPGCRGGARRRLGRRAPDGRRRARARRRPRPRAEPRRLPRAPRRRP